MSSRRTVRQAPRCRPPGCPGRRWPDGRHAGRRRGQQGRGHELEEDLEQGAQAAGRPAVLHQEEEQQPVLHRSRTPTRSTRPRATTRSPARPTPRPSPTRSTPVRARRTPRPRATEGTAGAPSSSVATSCIGVRRAAADGYAIDDQLRGRAVGCADRPLHPVGRCRPAGCSGTAAAPNADPGSPVRLRRRAQPTSSAAAPCKARRRRSARRLDPWAREISVDARPRRCTQYLGTWAVRPSPRGADCRGSGPTARPSRPRLGRRATDAG